MEGIEKIYFLEMYLRYDISAYIIALFTVQLINNIDTCAIILAFILLKSNTRN